MDVEAFLSDVRSSPTYTDQIVYVREVPAREARFADPAEPLVGPLRKMLAGRGIRRLYTHQAEAIDAVRRGENVLVVTGTASGKSLSYVVPTLELLLTDPRATALWLFPTKALSQDQWKGFDAALAAAGVADVLAGVYDGDTPATTRRKLRDHGSVIFSNPDMLHAAVMPQHGRWASFLARLKLLVIDELHVYNGIFGSNVTNLFRRFFRLTSHYGASPQIVACSATIGNPKELAEGLTGRPFVVVDRDGSPRGKRTVVFWNPPRVRRDNWRSRRSANVEAHELMAALVARGVPTITFSKAKMTAELIHRYVCETLARTRPALVEKVSAYRGGYLPEERREIERRLFSGELLGVSTTSALELGIDVGGLDACVVVGYPGRLANFFQQSGRAGRQDRDALVILVGLDTTVNQYVMTCPEYIFGRPVEQAVLDPDNPFVVIGHLRCATHELPLADEQAPSFGPHADMVLRVLADNAKVRHLKDSWYHAAAETPQHEVALRNYADRNIVIEDVETGAIVGTVNKFDAQPILHPGAIYMQQGEMYLVEDLDVEEKFVARVRRVDVDYYTQPIGGTDIHHVDHRLREKPFGTGMAYWGEVTAYFGTGAYERIHFYTLDPISVHEVKLPTFWLETMAVWIVPPEDLMEQVRDGGLDAHSGLRAIGYGTRMLLPLWMTCDTLDFSHTIGSVNSPWNAIFIYERYPHGLGFTEKAYERLHEIVPAVLANIRNCRCEDGCPCCVGKPLRQYTTWNVERGEASIPSKKAAIMILEGMLGDGSNLDNADTHAMTDSDEAREQRLERAVRRRLERMREPQVLHPIEPKVQTQFPQAEKADALPQADVARRAQRRTGIEKDLRRRLAKKIGSDKLDPHTVGDELPDGMKRRGAMAPTAFSGQPDVTHEVAPEDPPQDQAPIQVGDALAAKALKRRKKRERDET